MVRLAIARRWTPEDDALLVQLLEEGEAWPVIAARLKRTMAALKLAPVSCARGPRSGPSSRSPSAIMPRRPLIHRWTPEDTALLAKLLREGKTYVQIAREMKCSPSAVRNHASRLAKSERRTGGRG